MNTRLAGCFWMDLRLPQRWLQRCAVLEGRRSNDAYQEQDSISLRVDLGSQRGAVVQGCPIQGVGMVQHQDDFLDARRVY